MIKHIVTAKLKENTPEYLKAQMDLMLSMKENIPFIKEHEVHADFFHAPVSFDIVAISTFENKEDFMGYISHPYHADFVQTESNKYVSEIRIVDFEF